ncbi:DEAD/DEAH box helicase [Erythrobacter aureus]|uniref:ATP-dependent helicase n=1 Tax=Erythrobacter aureus TaxID=2182384 RepID=A0A345YIH6_9SPHN|nr:DEAD/DEAH box helicase family protein [Erythrobacter aureus]AXK43728.1 hypothetical protein DVR09_14820 [Erythrobacter aureus]
MSKDPAPVDFTEVTKIQERAIAEAVAALETGNMVLIEAPTGSGKTRINSRITEELEKRAAGGMKALNLSHREFLSRQGESQFKRWAPESNLTTSFGTDGTFDQSGSNVFALVQTVAARVDELERYDVVGIDEAHHASDAKDGHYPTVIPAVLKANPNAKIVMTTATPSRPDGKGMAKELKNATRVTIGWAELERAGQIKLPRTIEVPIEAKKGGTTNQVARAHYRPEKNANSAGLMKAVREARTDSFNEEMANAWERHAEGLQTIAFASRIKDAQSFADEMLERGHKVDVVDSERGADHNNAVLEKYARGELDMIVSVKMIDEGLDVPATRCTLILRESTSEIEYSQMVGRAIRAGDTPELRATQPLVIDGGASTMIHGAVERRAAVIDYFQKLERGERSEQMTAATLIDGKREASEQEGEYTPWRVIRDDPPVLSFTDQKGVVFAVESKDATGQSRYTLMETAEGQKGRTQLTLMKDENNRPIANKDGSILAEIENSRVLPSRAEILRLEATTSANPERASLADDRIAEASDAHLNSVLYMAEQMRGGASR